MSLIPFGFWAASGAGGAASSYDLLETTTLTSSASSVTFSGLGSYSDYAHLQIRWVGRTDYSGVSTTGVRLNGDSGSNYSHHYLQGNGSAVSAYGWPSNAYAQGGYFPGSGSGTDIFGTSILDILDFTSTTKNTTLRILSGVNPTSGLTAVGLFSSVWLSTAAVSSTTIFPATNDNYVTGSRFSLYGIKGA